MPPEAVFDNLNFIETDHDIWSLGVTLYEFYYGKPLLWFVENPAELKYAYL